MQDKCKDMRFIWDDFYFWSTDAGVKSHDISKLSEAEFVQYRRCFYPTEEESKEGKVDLGSAWEHHKAENYHHWENWTSIKDPTPNEWEVHCVQMVVDWMAMGYKFGDTAQKYYESNKEEIKLPNYAIRFIYEIFERIK